MSPPSPLVQALPLAATAVGLVALGITERLRHRAALARIGVRIHINGTRGKSSTTRLVAAGLRAAGRRTVGKTTGSLPRVLLPDGREQDVVRTGRANVIEQRDVVALAARLGAEALVLECMALRPRLQWLCEAQLVRATHAIITNVRPDHLEVMGPGEVDVARALCGMVPVGGRLYTSEARHLDVLAHAARDRGSKLIVTSDVRLLPEGAERCTLAPPTDAEMAGFSYREHADNVALALTLLHDLGVARDVALRGMWEATPDIGALSTMEVNFFGRRLSFVNGFAANDPVSTELIWRSVVARYLALGDGAGTSHADGRSSEHSRSSASCRSHEDAGTQLATAAQRPQASAPNALMVVNCRDDRPERSADLGRAAADWPRATRVLLMGRATHVFTRAWAQAGGSAATLLTIGDVPAAEVFECLLEHAGARAVIVGMGNIGGEGLALLRHFHNRRTLTENR